MLFILPVLCSGTSARFSAIFHAGYTQCLALRKFCIHRCPSWLALTANMILFREDCCIPDNSRWKCPQRRAESFFFKSNRCDSNMIFIKSCAEYFASCGGHVLHKMLILYCFYRESGGVLSIQLWDNRVISMWCDMIGCDMMRCALMGHDMIWYDMIWYDVCMYVYIYICIYIYIYIIYVSILLLVYYPLLSFFDLYNLVRAE